MGGLETLDWLTVRGRDLAACTQADVDAWLAGERPDRYIARQFARWATWQKLMPRLEFSAGHRGGPTPPITQRDRAELAERLLRDRTIPPRDRLAAILVAVYAQPIGRIARLTLEQATITDTGAQIRFGETPITLPEPVAAALRDWLDQRDARMPPVAAPSPWLFPGNPPTRPIGELSLSRRLKHIGVACNDERRAALLHLAGEIPAAILADLAGLHISTATAWAQIAGRPWGDYPALRSHI